MMKSLLERAMNKYRKQGILGVFAALCRRIFVRPAMKIKDKCIVLYLRKRYNYVI